MSILSDFEDRVAGAVEGVFAGAFRSPVQPAEIAKALAREMDEGRAVGVGKVYAPVSYQVLLSREDSDKMGSFTTTLSRELEVFLADHARRQGYHLASAPRVAFDTRRGLKLGRFEVSSELAASDEVLEEDWSEVSSEARPAPSVRLPRLPTGMATVTIGDAHHDFVLRGEHVSVGRLSESDIHLQDANVSRNHAAFVRDEGGWAIEDLGSTNGTFVNGQQVTHMRLKDGDIVSMGASKLVYHEPKG